MRKTFIASMLLMLAVMQPASGAVEQGKTYRIVPSTNPGKSLFVKNASTIDGTAVVVWTETDVPAQQWQVGLNDDGTATLRNVYTGHYLNASLSRLVQTAKPADWQIEPVDEQAGEYQLLLSGRSIRATNTNDGWQPVMSSSGTTWLLQETEPQEQLDPAARRRMIDGFLEQYQKEQSHNYCTFAGGGWNEAEIMEALLDFYEATGDDRYFDVFEKCYANLRYHVGSTWTGGTAVGGFNWYGYDFNDDVMWLIIAAARAYHLSGTLRYLNDARRNFDAIWHRAYMDFAGLLRWAEQSGDHNGANSCINGPAEVAACYIAAGLDDESYYEKARLLYENQRRVLYEPATGRVYDSVVLSPDDGSVVSRNTWASTYNQGTMLGAAVLLHRHYGDEQYLDDARAIIGFAHRELCNAEGIVSVCQNVDGDFQGFKGILMRYAGLYARYQHDDDYGAWVLANAWRAYNNMNSHSYGHSAWLTKAGEDLLYNNVDYSGMGSAFGATTALTAACGYQLPGDGNAGQGMQGTAGPRRQPASACYTLSGQRCSPATHKGLVVSAGRKLVLH